jgi:hypothetical protein
VSNWTRLIAFANGDITWIKGRWLTLSAKPPAGKKRKEKRE